MARISAGRRARQRRALLMISGAMSALVLLAAGSAWAITSYVNGSLGRVNAGTAGLPSSGPLNILVAGVDDRGGLTHQQQATLHVGPSQGETDTDTLMIVHVPSGRRSVQVVSLPRDSWVNIPGHGMAKINAALGIGGPRLMVQTVEQDTGVTINDYVSVNFLGFVKVIDALGGVNICLPYAVNDAYSGLNMSAGEHHVNGITALEFARDRHSFATSDFARIQDQQQLISSAFSEAISSGIVANPVRLESFLSALSAAIKVDQGFNVVSLAEQMRGISPKDVMFTTVPVGNASYVSPTGQSAVLWDGPAAQKLFAELKSNGRASARPRAKAAAHPLQRRQVSVDVYNGTFLGGLAASTGTQLTTLGFRVHQANLDWTSQDITQTMIQYPAGGKAAAQLVRRVLPGSVLRQVNGVARVRIVLGQTGHVVSAPAPGKSSPGSVAAQQKTAAQDACGH
jgi:LCP family protein required for cell wall assembly